MKHINLLIAPGLIVGVATLAYVSHQAGQVAPSNAVNAALLSPSSASPTPGMITVLEYLAAYWGARWPEVLAQLTADQLLILDQLIDPSQIPPWDAVAPGVRAHIHDGFLQQRTVWIEGYRDKDRELILTGAVLDENARALNARERLKLQAIVDQYAPQLELLAAQSFELMEEIDDQIWDKGLYQASPVLDPIASKVNQAPAALKIARITNADFWHVYYVIDSSEWPQLAEVLAEMSELRNEREREALAYLKGT